jgi:hypothetical protein
MLSLGHCLHPWHLGRRTDAHNTILGMKKSRGSVIYIQARDDPGSVFVRWVDMSIQFKVLLLYWCLLIYSECEDSISLPQHCVHCQLYRKSHVNSFRLVLKIRASDTCKCKILSHSFVSSSGSPSWAVSVWQQGASQLEDWVYIWWIFCAWVYRFRRVPQILCVWERYEQLRQQLDHTRKQ